MKALPTPDECYKFARDLAHDILENEQHPEHGEMPEEWFMYPENIKKLITYCQTPKP